MGSVEARELHVGQLVLTPGEGDDPYIEFSTGDRKDTRQTRNTVEPLAGTDAIRNRIDPLEEFDEWTDYLVPGQSIDVPMATDTARV